MSAVQDPVGTSPEVVEQLDATDACPTEFASGSDFEGIFAPLTTAEFLATRYRDKRAVLFRGPKHRFKSLVDWYDINRFVSNRALAPKMMVLPREGSVVPTRMVSDHSRPLGFRPMGEHAPVTDQKLTAVLRHGATLVLNRVNSVHPPVQALVNFIEDATGGYGQANLYASWTNSRGFATHWDTHDAFIFQVAGCKRWYVYGETRPFPLDLDVVPSDDPPGEPVWEGLLTAGDCLYIPRGMWHDARVETPDLEGLGSLHLTLSTVPVTGQNLIRWLGAKLAQHELFRRDLPIQADEREQQARFAELRDLIVTTLDSVSMDDFMSDLRTCWSEPPETTLDISIEPWKLGDPHWGSCEVSIRGARRSEIRSRSNDSTFELVANGQTWTFDRHCLALVEFLVGVDGASVSTIKESFAGSHSAKFIDEFLQGLVERGAAKVAIPDSVRDLW